MTIGPSETPKAKAYPSNAQRRLAADGVSPHAFDERAGEQQSPSASGAARRAPPNRAPIRAPDWPNPCVPAESRTGHGDPRPSSDRNPVFKPDRARGRRVLLGTEGTDNPAPTTRDSAPLGPQVPRFVIRRCTRGVDRRGRAWWPPAGAVLRRPRPNRCPDRPNPCVQAETCIGGTVTAPFPYPQQAAIPVFKPDPARRGESLWARDAMGPWSGGSWGDGHGRMRWLSPNSCQR